MRAHIFAFALCFGLLACDKAPNPVAPSGTIVTVTASPSKISLTGQASSVTVTGILPAGNPIRPGTQISLSSSLGVLRPAGSSCTGSATVSIVEADDRGQAVASLCGDGRGGEATVTASLTSAGSGEGASGSATVTVQIGETDASRPTVLISANPTTIPVCGDSTSSCETSTITLLGRASDGTAVGAGQRIRLTTNLGTLTCAAPYRCAGESGSPCNAVCTDSRGEAQATLLPDERGGTAEVSAILGTSETATVEITVNSILDSLTLTVNPPDVDRLDAGDTVTLRAILLDPLGVPLSNVLVRFDSEEGTLNPPAESTNSSGIAESTLTVTRSQLANIPAGGSFTVSATATSEGQTRADSVEVTVNGNP